MALSASINDLITAYKAMPQSMWRNKTVSKLQDALACAVMCETMNDTSFVQKPDTANFTGISRAMQSTTEQCICPDGAIATDCALHGIAVKTN